MARIWCDSWGCERGWAGSRDVRKEVGFTCRKPGIPCTGGGFYTVGSKTPPKAFEQVGNMSTYVLKKTMEAVWHLD